jgi:hypothetical protein
VTEALKKMPTPNNILPWLDIEEDKLAHESGEKTQHATS